MAVSSELRLIALGTVTGVV